MRILTVGNSFPLPLPIWVRLKSATHERGILKAGGVISCSRPSHCAVLHCAIFRCVRAGLRFETGSDVCVSKMHTKKKTDAFSARTLLCPAPRTPRRPQFSQRVASFLLYLNEWEEGGETVFPLEGPGGIARLNVRSTLL